jgi:hypothetical protein
MTKTLGLLLLATTVAGGAAGPTYDVTPTRGDHDFLFSFRQSAQLVFSPPQDNALSTWQTLPFAWKFFGQDVKGYFVSDNGYITFDRDAKTSSPANTSLTDPATPRNSIFALWTDLRMDAGHGPWAGSVYAATMGTAPNRVHLLYWMNLTPAADSFEAAGLLFALALYENGEFEVIYTSGRKATPVKATVGALSADGKTAAPAAGPAFDFPAVAFGGDDDEGFRFKPVIR